MRVIIISLKRAVERRKRLSDRLDALKIPHEYLDAVDVTTIPKAELERQAMYWPAKVSAKDIACYFSHFAAWQRAAASDGPCLICEDDLIVSRKLPSVLVAIAKHLAPNAIYDLEATPKFHVLSKNAAWEDVEDGFHALKIYQNKNGAGAYAMLPSTAQQMVLENGGRFGLIDTHVWNRKWADYLQIEPAPIFQDIYAQHYLNERATRYESEMRERTYGRPRRSLISRAYRLNQQLAMVPSKIAGMIYGKRRKIEVIKSDFLE